MASSVNEPLTIVNGAESSTLEDLNSLPFSSPSSSSSNSNSNQSNLDASTTPAQSTVVNTVPAESQGDSSLGSAVPEVSSSEPEVSGSSVPTVSDSEGEVPVISAPESEVPVSFVPAQLDQTATQLDQTATAPTPASALAHSSPPTLPDAASMDKASQPQPQSSPVIPIMAGVGALLVLLLLIVFLVYRLRRLRRRRIERIMNSLSVDFGYIEIVGGLRGKQREGAMGKLMGKNHSLDAGWAAGRPRTGNWDLALAMAQEFVLGEQHMQSQSESEFSWLHLEPDQKLESLPPRLPEPARIPGIRISECSTLAPSEYSIAI